MDEKKSNIPSQLQGAPTRDLKIIPQDPETAAEVNAFIAQKTAESGGGPSEPAPDQPGQPEIEQRPIEVPPNAEFSGITPQDASISDALASDTAVVVTDMEREIFLKAVLNDEPVRLTVKLYHDRFQVELRSRTTFEQRRIFDVLEADRHEGVIDKENIALMVTRMQYYLAALMVEKINNLTFSDLTLDLKDTMEVHKKQLRAKVAEHYENMVGVRWNSIATALRIFENKCARMNTEALNEGFWKPQGFV